MHPAVLCLLPLVASAAATSESSPSDARAIPDTAGRQLRYDGHVVLRVVPRTLADVVAVEKLLLQDSEVDAWRPPSRVGDDVQIQIPPWRLDAVVGDLDGLRLNHTVLIRDVQSYIDNSTTKATKTAAGPAFGFDNYHRIDTIYDWMRELARVSGGAASIVEGGLTTEGRHILGVRVAHAPDLPVVVLEGGVHGREWASTAAAAFVLDQLLGGEDPEVRLLARSYEWHVFPSVNPDGYEYSHTTDRLWTKSRARTTVRCYGVDLNRNFPHHWGTTGVSWDMCSNMYPGTRAASEVETRTRMAYLRPLLGRTKAFVALHGHGQYLLFPWGHIAARDMKHDELMTVGSKSAEAFARRNGTALAVGSWSENLRPVSGSSMDWMRSKDVPYTFTLGLRDHASSIFLPADQIVPASEEVMNALVGLLNAIAEQSARGKIHAETRDRTRDI